MSEEVDTPPGRPGIVVRGFPPDTTDTYILELYFEKFGEDVVKNVEIVEDRKSAYVEFSDPSGNSTVINCLNVTRMFNIPRHFHD